MTGSLGEAIDGHGHGHLRKVDQGSLAIEVGRSLEADILGLGIGHGKPDVAEVLEDIQYDASDIDWDTDWHQTEVESALVRDNQAEEGIALLSDSLFSWVAWKIISINTE